MGKIGKASVPHLREILRSKVREPSERAAGALGCVGPDAKDAVPDLIDALKDEELSPTASQALGWIGPNAKPAIPHLLKILRDRRNSSLARWRVIDSLVLIGPDSKEVMAVLIEMITDKDGTVATQAVYGLAAFGSKAKEAVPVLIEMLKSKYPSDRRNAVRALGSIGPNAKAALPALKIALEDDDKVWDTSKKEKEGGEISKAAAEAIKKINKKINQ